MNMAERLLNEKECTDEMNKITSYEHMLGKMIHWGRATEILGKKYLSN